ncbi:MAG TPA: redox-sensing transcriptional repressor Rex [Candidatus Dormibacteraeota bacterium]|nr:redox-sensing transcriptional repressor Rex [Candidatus Dormibacteraeota bacterium]
MALERISTLRAGLRALTGRSGGRVNELNVPRLFLYHRALVELSEKGVAVVTSESLAELCANDVTPTQIRKDLSQLGTLGRRGHGYEVTGLLRLLARVLGLDQDWRIAIVGFGYLGHALATFLTYREERFRITALFDRSPEVVGQRWNDLTVSHVDDFERVLTDLGGADIAVLAVPSRAAQETADRVVAAGVDAILNFAPVALRVPDPVFARNIDLAGELSILTHFLTGSD